MLFRAERLRAAGGRVLALMVLSCIRRQRLLLGAKYLIYFRRNIGFRSKFFTPCKSLPIDDLPNQGGDDVFAGIWADYDNFIIELFKNLSF
jgi:hypothetical protein